MAAIMRVARTRRAPHVPYEDPDTPGVCSVCKLPILINPDGTYVNDSHVTLGDLMAKLIVSDYDVMALAAGER